MLGIITGTSLIGKQFEGTRKTVRTKHGNTEIFEGDHALFLPRHGMDADIPPHKINYLANIAAMQKYGVDGVVGVYSTGSMKLDIPPGTLVVPHDYIDFGGSITFYNDEIRHVVPELDQGLRDRLIRASHGRAGGVYVRTRGPRFETKAEILMLSRYADLVGMTMASEATLCCEINIPIAAICTVDNYANGVSNQELSQDAVTKNAGKNRSMIEETITRLIE
ncbi:MAG: 5'-methylthioadenosine phosphorylase [Methanosarcinales archaeon]|nr:MAG: 5'-methylthioadenosine phosphorylase [Methanosarcinales archaeon]